MSENFIYRRSPKVRWIFLFSLFLAVMFDSIALSFSSSAIAPAFSLLVVLFWAGHFLDRSYIATAFVMGLLTDTLFQTPLGAHALLFVSLVYLLSRHRLHFQSYTYWQQSIFMIGYFFLYQIGNWLFFSPILSDQHFIYFWLMPFTAALAWLMIAPVLNKLTQQIEKN